MFVFGGIYSGGGQKWPPVFKAEEIKMKLILCVECEDVFKLGKRKKRCKCRKSWGKYDKDGYNATYGGKHAVPIGFANLSLVRAINHQPKEAGPGMRFDAFVIPKECSTFVKIKEDES
jgi:hypothetical protein